LFLLQELFTGCYALLSYASLIFQEAGSTLSPNISAIIIGCIQVVGVYLSTFLVDRAGRRFLMITSGSCCALGLTVFAVYDYMKVNGMNVSELNWIPLFSFSFVIFFANFGTRARERERGRSLSSSHCLFLLLISTFICRPHIDSIPHTHGDCADEDQERRVHVQSVILMDCGLLDHRGTLNAFHLHTRHLNLSLSLSSSSICHRA
jgi:hypothetical protein